jgi:ribosomal protein L13
LSDIADRPGADRGDRVGVLRAERIAVAGDRARGANDLRTAERTNGERIGNRQSAVTAAAADRLRQQAVGEIASGLNRPARHLHGDRAIGALTSVAAAPDLEG